MRSSGSRISQMGVANPKGGDGNLLFGQIFPQNSMKTKNIGPKGEHAALAYPSIRVYP